MPCLIDGNSVSMLTNRDVTRLARKNSLSNLSSLLPIGCYTRNFETPVVGAHRTGIPSHTSPCFPDRSTPNIARNSHALMVECLLAPQIAYFRRRTHTTDSCNAALACFPRYCKRVKGTWWAQFPGSSQFQRWGGVCCFFFFFFLFFFFSSVSYILHCGSPISIQTDDVIPKSKCPLSA